MHHASLLILEILLGSQQHFGSCTCGHKPIVGLTSRPLRAWRNDFKTSRFTDSGTRSVTQW